jgi:hypothetical protein
LKIYILVAKKKDYIIMGEMLENGEEILNTCQFSGKPELKLGNL